MKRMRNPLTNTLKKLLLRLPIGFTLILLSPFIVMAEPTGTSCELARTQVEHTRNTLLPLEQQQEQIQQHVKTIYQELFACQSGTALSLEQQKHCTHLQEEGAKNFQIMINVITLTHQTSQQLALQSRQFQLACLDISAKDILPKTTSLPSLPKNVARNYKRR